MSLFPVSSQASSKPSSSSAVRLEKLRKLYQVLTKKDKSDKDISKAFGSLIKVDQEALRAKISIPGVGSTKAQQKKIFISFVKKRIKGLSPSKTDRLFQANIAKSNPFSRVPIDLQSMGIGPFLSPKDIANFSLSFKEAAVIGSASHIIKTYHLDSLIETYLHRSCADLTESKKIQALHELMCMANSLSDIEKLPRPSYSLLHTFFQKVEARNLIRMMEKIHQNHLALHDLPKGVKNLKVPKDVQWTMLKAKKLRRWLEQHQDFLSTIKTLQLIYCNLTLLPKEIGQFQGLQNLILYRNHLTTLPKEIEQLQVLENLDLSYNQFTTLSKGIYRLKTLRVLSLNGNCLVNISPEIRRLQRLEELWLQYNRVASLPKEIGQLKSLRRLLMAYNHLVSLPQEIGKLKGLITLDLLCQHLTRLPKEISQLRALQWLRLTNNRLGSVPKEIGRLHTLPDCIIDYTNNGLISNPDKLAQFNFDLQRQNKQLQLKTILKELSFCVTGRHDIKRIADLLNTMEKLFGKKMRSQLHGCMYEVAKEAAKKDKSLRGQLKDKQFARKAIVDAKFNPKLKAAAIELFRKTLESQAVIQK